MATIKTQGFKEMDAALGEFSKATARNILKRAGLKALEPVVTTAKGRVHRRTGELQESIEASDKLSPRQKRLNRQPSTVELYAGPAGDAETKAPPQGTFEEFGTEDHPPHPFLRPAWDTNQSQVLETVKDELGGEIEKATQRAQRKALKAKG